MPLARVVADTPLNPVIESLLAGKVEILPWSVAMAGTSEPVAALYTYGHPQVDGALLDRLPGLKVISNYGVGVDHICLPDAAARGIPVGNTPGILDGATADMGFALLLATARRLVEGDRYARCGEFTRYDPGYMLGQEVHGRTLGIIGMGRIGRQVAKRARAFDMPVLYYNRRPNAAVEQELQARYVSCDELLRQADYVMLCCPLSEETRGLINEAALAKMKSTAILVNIARGPVVDTDALTAALASRQIYAAGLDVTDPEPLPRNHPLLQLDNVTIAPHLGSATEQTRRQMAEISVENLLRGIQGQPLLHQVK
ncbi:2-hydroxyacid dehydrogenase [Anatilimnocola sp. NA78]|uniref:2-hydroxyacid dehydrogenase n=1 Tax=Anatilimnocola sp. NA78 TaxID=3415683 RepID=UPI003CE5B5B7